VYPCHGALACEVVKETRNNKVVETKLFLLLLLPILHCRINCWWLFYLKEGQYSILVLLSFSVVSLWWFAVTSGKYQNSSFTANDGKSDSESQQHKPSILVVSGGEGYVDFRIGSNNTGETCAMRGTQVEVYGKYRVHLCMSVF